MAVFRCSVHVLVGALIKHINEERYGLKGKTIDGVIKLNVCFLLLSY